MVIRISFTCVWLGWEENPDGPFSVNRKAKTVFNDTENVFLHRVYYTLLNLNALVG